MSMNLNLVLREGSRKEERIDLFQTPTEVSYSIVPRHRSEITSENLQEFIDAAEKYLRWVDSQWPDVEDNFLYEEERSKLNDVIQRCKDSQNKSKRTKNQKKVVAEFFVM